MQEVTFKINSLKLKISKLLHMYKSISKENNSLKKTVVSLEDKIKKLENNESSNSITEEFKTKIGDSINEIEEVIKLLS